MIGETPYFFDCQFSDELDDYPDLYVIWPASAEELADELEVFNRFSVWRRKFDAGEVTDPHYMDECAAARRVKQRRQEWPPPDSIAAKPEWKLDRNRRFTATSPRHRVRWHVQSR